MNFVPATRFLEFIPLPCAQSFRYTQTYTTDSLSFPKVQDLVLCLNMSTLASRNSLSSSTLLLLCSYISLAVAQCSTFSAAGPIYTELGAAVVVSDAVTCQSSQGCEFGNSPNTLEPDVEFLDVQIGGIYKAQYTVSSGSYQATASTASSLVSIIEKTVPDEDPAIVVSNITAGLGFGMSPSQSAYIVFFPDQHCVNGSFSGCSGSDYPSDGEVLTACTPYVAPDGCQTTGAKKYPCLVGTYSTQNVSQQDANTIKCTVCTDDDNGNPSAASGGFDRSSTFGMSAFAAFVAIAVGTLVF